MLDQKDDHCAWHPSHRWVPLGRLIASSVALVSLLLTVFPRLHPRAGAGTMGIKGVRVLTFSPFEMKAFGGFYYEAKKKVLWHFGNLSSTWATMLPIFAGTWATIKWAENKYEEDARSHRD